MAATLKDIAELTGYSVGTISNYINGRVTVSEQKRTEIEAAIENLHYKVNLAARMLKTNEFKTIGVLIPDFRNTFLVHVVSCMETIINENGYDMMVLSYHKDSDKQLNQELKMLQYLSQRVDGIVYVPTAQEAPQAIADFVSQIQEHTPVVTFNEIHEQITCDNVLLNNADTVERAIELLFQRGHRSIGILLGPESAYTSRLRKVGYCRAFEKRNWYVHERLIVSGNYSKTDGKQLCEELLANNPDLTAIFVVGYRMTIGVLSKLNELGLSQDITVVGYDAMDIADIINPRIGVIYQPYEQIAAQAVSLVFQRVHGNNDNFPQRIELDAELKNLESLPYIAPRIPLHDAELETMDETTVQSERASIRLRKRTSANVREVRKLHRKRR